jgi:hypothetical protein
VVSSGGRDLRPPLFASWHQENVRVYHNCFDADNAEAADYAECSEGDESSSRLIEAVFLLLTTKTQQ